MLFDLESLSLALKAEDELLDEVAFWLRYLPIAIELFDQEVEEIKSVIMQNPLKYVR